jgi:hypothetical protein
MSRLLNVDGGSEPRSKHKHEHVADDLETQLT